MVVSLPPPSSEEQPVNQPTGDCEWRTEDERERANVEGEERRLVDERAPGRKEFEVGKQQSAEASATRER